MLVQHLLGEKQHWLEITKSISKNSQSHKVNFRIWPENDLSDLERSPTTGLSHCHYKNECTMLCKLSKYAVSVYPIVQKWCIYSQQKEQLILNSGVRDKNNKFCDTRSMKSYGKHRQNNYNQRAILLENICIDVHEQYKRGLLGGCCWLFLNGYRYFT